MIKPSISSLWLLLNLAEKCLNINIQIRLLRGWHMSVQLTVTFQLMFTTGTRVVFTIYVLSHVNGKKRCLKLTAVSLVRKITTVIGAVTPPGGEYALAIVTCER